MVDLGGYTLSGHDSSNESYISVAIPIYIHNTYHGLDDDCKIFSGGVEESDIAPSTRQMPCTTTDLQVHIAYLAELCSVGCMCMEHTARYYIIIIKRIRQL